MGDSGCALIAECDLGYIYMYLQYSFCSARKYPYLLPRKTPPPPCPLWKLYISLNVLVLQNSHPQEILIISVGEGSMDVFWNCTLWLLLEGSLQMFKNCFEQGDLTKTQIISTIIKSTLYT